MDLTEGEGADFIGRIIYDARRPVQEEIAGWHSALIRRIFSQLLEKTVMNNSGGRSS